MKAIFNHMLRSLISKLKGYSGPLSAFSENHFQNNQIFFHCPASMRNIFVHMIIPVLTALFWSLEGGSLGVEKNVA